jgi:class 3 adenylate cyclase/YHS domain-containing protein
MSDDSTIEATFCFVDIAGYTALTDTHGGQAAADLVDEFAALVRSTTEPRGRLQSLIGDCAFLVFPDPVTATTALAALYAEIADRRHFPIVRTGLHHGPALCRGDRHFGSTVNIAARVAAQAVGGELLCTEGVAQALAHAKHPDVTLVHRGAAALKNLSEPLDLYEIVLAASAREFVIDPVCKMQVDKRRAAGDLHFNDRTYWFCSLSCVERFAKQPSSYARTEGQADA